MAMRRILGFLSIALLLLASCNKEEFPINSSFFTNPENDSKTLVYEGKKAGDFEHAADQMDWSGIKKLILKGHINNKDIGIIKRYIAETFDGELRELDFRDAEVFEGQFINSPFHKLKNLEHFVYPKKIKSTGDNVMSESFWVREIIIPQDVEIIGDKTFEIVSFRIDFQGTGQVFPIDIPHMAKERYQLPKTVKEIGEFAYRYYPYQELSLPESVETIKRGCFANSKLTSFTFPAKVTAVPDECFFLSNDLESINLPEGLTSIGSAAFEGTKIQELLMPDGVNQVGEGFLSGIKLKKIKWSQSLTELSVRAMRGSQLDELHIPDQITKIGESCFYQSTIKRIWFHQNISSLGLGFINGMSNLEEVHITWAIPPAANSLINDILISPLGKPEYNKSPDFEKVKLFVPKGTSIAYKNATGWKNFKQIIEE